jgi:hypothetical protein
MDDVSSTPVAVLKLPQSDPLLILFAKAILESMTGNLFFPDPSPTLAVISANIAAYEKAQGLAIKRGQGAATQRDGKRKKVVANLNHLRDYVQSVIENYPPEDAATMIISAGMSIKQPGTRTKDAVRARNGDTSGEVLLDARAVADVAMYYWQYSLNQVDWVDVPEMMKASAVVSGLTPLKTYYFRFRAMTRKGPRDYSQVVGLLVL